MTGYRFLRGFPAALLLAATVGSAVLLATPPVNAGSTTVEIGDLNVPERDAKQQKTQTKWLARALRAAAKSADFGNTKAVTISAKLTEWEVEESDDLIRVTCTLVAHLEGGPSARSHISFGGHPKKKTALQKDVLRMVSEGVMTRLAHLAKEKADKEEKSDDKE